MQGNGTKLIAVIALLLISLWKLYPTVQNAMTRNDLAAMDEDARDAYEEANYDRLQKIRESSLNLGLDLQGGMHVTLEVGTGALLQALAEGRTDDIFTNAIATANEQAASSSADYVSLFTAAVEAAQPGRSLARYFRNADAEINARSSNDDVEAYLRTEVNEALTRGEEIIRQRIDRFGVTEPLIQRQGATRIVVELPGVDNPKRVRDLLRGTAKLSFHLTPPGAEVQSAVQRITALYAGADPAPAAADTAASDSTAAPGDSSTALDVAALTGGAPAAATPGAAAGEKTFSQMFRPVGNLGPNSPVFGQVAESDTAAVRRLLDAPAAKALLPPGSMVLWTSNAEGETAEGDPVFNLIVVNQREELGGEVITDAGPNFDPYTNAPEVSLTMNSEGASRWRQITGANVEKPVAIVLDGIVYTYPTINGVIPNGRTSITGQFSTAEVNDIVTVLKSGALPAPVNIVEERTVGPSLGAASIRAGTRALLIGFVLVCIFMALYYRGAGLVADVALVLNVLFIFGVLSAFGATLTLPGMAGIVLTIGMAVDANVLIFERIREELTTGKTLRAAVDGGFEKALSAIVDANITTFLIGVILFSFGVGPIQGFAVTLMAGILTSLFSALVVTRLLIDYLVRTRGTAVAFG
jgi:preprotein translocase subunit SecD